jgi:hypothetical protein
LASAENDEFGGEIEIEEIGESEIGFTIASLGIKTRKNNARKCGVDVVKDAVSGEMNVAILANLWRRNPVVGGIKPEG